MKRKSISILCIALAVNMLLSVVAFAADINPEPYVEYTITASDPTLDGAEHLSSDSYIENGRLITIDVYRMPDGMIVTDTLNRSAFAMYSSEGSDTVTRTKDLQSWGSITLTASFDWYTEDYFSYVRCSSASASHDIDEKADIRGFNVTKSDGYIKLGTAYAQVAYKMIDKATSLMSTSGKFKITCKDNGTISDNG